jgi:ketosteroid isomerase-like protein
VNTDMPAEIQAFFDTYRDAFNRLDGRAVSAHYDRPAMMIHAGGTGIFLDEAALDANNVALCEQYAKSGFLRADFEEHTFLPQGDSFCVVDLAWRIERRGQAPQQFNTAYSLAKRKGKWKVAMVTAYAEGRPWSEHG